jgi:predicted Zn-dependent peptidase
VRHDIKKVDPKTKRPLGLDGGAQVLIREDPGLFAMFGVYLDPAAGDKIEKLLADEVAAVAAKGVTADELRTAKNQIQAGFVFGLESVDGIANQIGLSWILTGDPTQFLRDLEMFEKVTAADVKRVAKQYLTPERSTVVVIPPQGAAK